MQCQTDPGMCFGKQFQKRKERTACQCFGCADGERLPEGILFQRFHFGVERFHPAGNFQHFVSVCGQFNVFSAASPYDQGMSEFFFQIQQPG